LRNRKERLNLLLVRKNGESFFFIYHPKNINALVDTLIEFAQDPKFNLHIIDIQCVVEVLTEKDFLRPLEVIHL